MASMTAVAATEAIGSMTNGTLRSLADLNRDARTARKKKRRKRKNDRARRKGGWGWGEWRLDG